MIEYDAFDKYFEKLTMENAPSLIDSLFKLDVKHKRFKKRILGILKKIDMESQELLLEYCIIANENDTKNCFVFPHHSFFYKFFHEKPYIRSIG